MLADPGSETAHLVVVNEELQYSIWRADAELPPGWTAEGTSGTREQCLAHIDDVWTDMRPLSVRRAMEPTQSA
ncbi:MbtH family protein [Streptomyces sp. NPDC005046]